MRIDRDESGPARTECRLTCPNCGHASIETMPTNACVYFHECAGCGTMLRPKPGDCCVFCSYGDRPCPPRVCGAEAGPATPDAAD